MSELYIFVTSHNTHAQGGQRKTHIHDVCGILCGRKQYGIPIGIITPEWLLQPDPDGDDMTATKTAKFTVEPGLSITVGTPSAVQMGSMNH